MLFQCVPILGRGFETGGYKCECKQGENDDQIDQISFNTKTFITQGYEYPFEDPITYFDGQLMEAEFVNMVRDKESK